MYRPSIIAMASKKKHVPFVLDVSIATSTPPKFLPLAPLKRTTTSSMDQEIHRIQGGFRGQSLQIATYSFGQYVGFILPC